MDVTVMFGNSQFTTVCPNIPKKSHHYYSSSCSATKDFSIQQIWLHAANVNNLAATSKPKIINLGTTLLDIIAGVLKESDRFIISSPMIF
jgi:microcystin-dependent protein